MDLSRERFTGFFGKDNSAVSYALSNTGIEADIEVLGTDSDGILMMLDMSDLYETSQIVEATELAVDVAPQGVQTVLGSQKTYLKINNDEIESTPGDTVLNYIEEFDQGLSNMDGMTDERESSVMDAVNNISIQGLGARWTEELPYSDLGVDVVYQGTQGDENFTYSFNEWMYDDHGRWGELQKSALESVGPEEVEMDLENPREASVSVESEDVTEAVQDVYDHLKAIDQEYAQQSEGSYSRPDKADEINEMIEAFEE